MGGQGQNSKFLHYLVACYATQPRFVGPSIRPSVRRSALCNTYSFGLLRSLASLLLPKWSSDLKNSPCPPACDWGSRVSGLVQLNDPWWTNSDHTSFAVAIPQLKRAKAFGTPDIIIFRPFGPLNWYFTCYSGPKMIDDQRNMWPLEHRWFAGVASMVLPSRCQKLRFFDILHMVAIFLYFFLAGKKC